MPATHAQADGLIDAIFGTNVITGTRYIALHSAQPTKDSPAELSGGAYARQAPGTITKATDASGYRRGKNGAVITFPTPSANWSTVTHVGLWAGVPGQNGSRLLWIWDVADVTPLRDGSVSIQAGAMYIEFPFVAGDDGT